MTTDEILEMGLNPTKNRIKQATENYNKAQLNGDIKNGKNTRINKNKKQHTESKKADSNGSKT